MDVENHIAIILTESEVEHVKTIITRKFLCYADPFRLQLDVDRLKEEKENIEEEIKKISAKKIVLEYAESVIKTKELENKVKNIELI